MPDFYALAQMCFGDMVRVRRVLHADPELGFSLPRTTRFVCGELRAAGLDPQMLGGSGVLCEVAGAAPGKTILLRADMDALPMCEQSGLPFASKIQAAHCCGHDLHTSMLLCAASMLQQNRQSLRGRVRCLFQPAEETALGMRAMLEAGLLDTPADAAVGLHVAPEKPCGRLNFTKGPKAASFDNFRITVRGEGGHGAQPQLAKDSIFSAVQIYSALQGIITRQTPQTEPDVLTVGRFCAGTAGNIIPDTAVLEGTVRAKTQQQRELMLRRLREIGERTAAVFDTQAVCEILAGVPPLVCDGELVRELCTAAGTLPQLEIEQRDDWMTASEDFALLAQRVPSAYVTLGTGGRDRPYGNHNPRVVYDERAMIPGAAALAAMAFYYCTEE
ncbi:MAG: M20 family metallopeptidase [Oscillospiraceae bacterium]|nr:M20 family metallopeptidase [Oscillospiraceae bacterium]